MRKARLSRLCRNVKWVVLLVAVSCLSACGGGGDLLMGYLLYDQFLRNGGNSGIWSGQVRDSLGKPLEGYVISITADRPEPDEDITRTGISSKDGSYRITVPWYENAFYTATVSFEGTTLLSKEIGLVANKDQDLDFEIPVGLSNVTVSGKVIDRDENELSQVFVSVAKPQSVGGEPNSLITEVIDSKETIRFVVTNASGAFLFEKVYGKPLLIVGFNPEQGFGYLLVEEPTSLSAGGDLVMPGAKNSSIKAKVLDEAGNVIGSRVLSQAERFDLVLTPAFNLSEQVGAAVSNAGLFGGISAQEVIAIHPTTKVLEVRSTAHDGVSDQSISVLGGLYNLTLKKPDGSDYDGVVIGQNPRMIFGDSEVVVDVKIKAS